MMRSDELRCKKNGLFLDSLQVMNGFLSISILAYYMRVIRERPYAIQRSTQGNAVLSSALQIYGSKSYRMLEAMYRQHDSSTILEQIIVGAA